MGTGYGGFSHQALYRYFRNQRFDILDGRNSGIPMLITALLAGVPHRIGPVPKGRAQRAMVDAGLWIPWQPTDIAASGDDVAALIARYNALYRADH